MSTLFLVAAIVIGIWWMVCRVFTWLGIAAIAAEDAVRRATRARADASAYDEGRRRAYESIARLNGERDALAELSALTPRRDAP